MTKYHPKPNLSKFHEGYFIMARTLFDSQAWALGSDHVKLLVYLVGRARHKREPHRLPGNIEIRRGELITSLARIVEENTWVERNTLKTWSRQKVSRMLHDLDDIDSVELLADTYGTHIKLVNYAAYQDAANYFADSRGTVADSGGTAPGMNKHGNHGKHDKNNTQKGVDNGAIVLLQETKKFCAWWSKNKKVPVSHKFMTHVNPAFTDRVPYDFAIDEAKSLSATTDPWDLAKLLVKAWRHARQYDSQRAKKFRPSRDAGVRRTVDKLTKKMDASHM